MQMYKYIIISYLLLNNEIVLIKEPASLLCAMNYLFILYGILIEVKTLVRESH